MLLITSRPNVLCSCGLYNRTEGRRGDWLTGLYGNHWLHWGQVHSGEEGIKTVLFSSCRADELSAANRRTRERTRVVSASGMTNNVGAACCVSGEKYALQRYCSCCWDIAKSSSGHMHAAFSFSEYDAVYRTWRLKGGCGGWSFHLWDGGRGSDKCVMLLQRPVTALS